MKARNLVRTIKKGLDVLELSDEVDFRRSWLLRRDYRAFLEALQLQNSIQTVKLHGSIGRGLSREQCLECIRTLRGMKGLKELVFVGGCVDDEVTRSNTISLQAVTSFVTKSRSLEKLVLEDGVVLHTGSGDRWECLPNGFCGLPLREFTWHGELKGHSHNDVPTLDPLLFSLTSWPNLRKARIKLNCNKIKDESILRLLLRSKSLKELTLDGLTSSQWMLIMDEITQGQHSLAMLDLSLASSKGSNECALAAANVIQHDSVLQSLTLRVSSGFSNDAGVAFAHALTVNTTLQELDLMEGSDAHVKDRFGSESYQAMAEMLKVNTDHQLIVPMSSSPISEANVVSDYTEMVLEMELNRIGRGRLSPAASRAEWVQGLLDCKNVESSFAPNLDISCMFALLRLNPSVCQR